MALLYIANTTKQHREFHYRIPGQAQLYVLKIAPGCQEHLPHTELTESEYRSILEQHARYGVIDQKDIPNMRAYTGLCYSIGKKIDMRRIVAAIEKNDDILRANTDVAHKENIAAADHVLKQATGGNASMTSVDIEEKVSPNENRQGVQKKLKMAK